MRKAYNRAGLSVLVLYGVMSVVSTVVLLVMGVIGAMVTTLRSSSILDALRRSNPLNQNDLLRAFEGSDFLVFIILGMVIGSALGMFVGIKIMKKILPERNNIPIPKQTLSGGEIGLMIAMAFGLWGVGTFIGNLPSWFGGGALFTEEPKIMIIYSLYAVIGAPFFEELAFRKTLLNALHPYGEAPAAFASALLFGLMHGNPGQFMLAFMLGLLLAAVYQRTGKIIYTMLLHFLINFSATVPDVVIMFAGHAELVTNIWYIVMGVIVIAGIVLLIVFGRKQRFLALSQSGNPSANRSMFRNPGMLIAVIGGTILVTLTKAATVLLSLESRDPGPLLTLEAVPAAACIVVVILVTTRIGRPFKTEEEPIQPQAVSGDYGPGPGNM